MREIGRRERERYPAVESLFVSFDLRFVSCYIIFAKKKKKKREKSKHT